MLVVFAVVPAFSQGSREVEIGSSYETLTDNFSPWLRNYLNFTQRITSRKIIYGVLERTTRYSQTDSALTAGAYVPVGHRSTAVIEGNVSPSHRVLPQWTVLGQLEHDFGRGWTGQAGLRRRKYNTNSVGIGNAGVAKSIGPFRAAYILYTSRLAGTGTAFTNRIDVTRHYADNAVSMTVAFGRELEQVLPAGIVRTNVALMNVRGTHWFHGNWGVSYALDVHRQGTLYRRQGLTIGLKYRSQSP